ncbi:hypothetical protein QF046_001180 [Microbacterium sp. W4I4]|uniref:hypothetical protein n=1 Tax=Microbacterium sp. W4I4 TaxID=3042295 RepID=UPI002785D6D9|nr:hypothetical protein [Microbacterium sp. W4I4]MDQ0613539.1 hypothetical protein [Microbacterium sp. W4I4]
MILSQVVWWITLMAVLLVALFQLFGATILWVPEYIPWPLGGSAAEVATTVNRTAASFVQVVLTLGLIEGACGFTAFISATNPHGPHKTVRMRDYASATFQSLTGRWFLFGAMLAVLLSIELQRSAETRRAIVSLVLLGLLITVWILVLNGIRRITATNRSAPYFSGMTDDQKALAENPWPTRSKPTFPVPGQTGSMDDALRYARRAHSIARLHEWIGGGIIALATAVLGAAVAQFFLPVGDVSPWIISIVALVALGLGYAIHRRGGQYNRLREQFAHTAEALNQATANSGPVDRGLRGWIRRLLG